MRDSPIFNKLNTWVNWFKQTVKFGKLSFSYLQIYVIIYNN
jgi:hypothetical protein